MKFRGSVVFMLLCAAAGAQPPASEPASQPAAPPTGPTIAGTTVPLSTLGDATPVTLKLNNAVLKEAFDKLEAASHVHVVLAQVDMLTRTDDHPVSVDFKGEPYLSAMLELCRQAGCQVNFMGSRLMLLPSPDRRSIPPHTTAGPLAIYCNAATISRELHYGTTPTRSASVSLNFSLISEPRVPLMGIDGPPTNVHAVDVQNRPISPLDAPVSGVASRMDSMGENRFFSVQLVLPPDAGDVLRTVSGTVFVRAVTKIDTLKIKDLASAEGTTTTLGDSSFTVVRVDQQPGGQCAVDLEVRSETLSPTFFTRMCFGDSQFAPRLDAPANAGQGAAIGVPPGGVAAGGIGPNGIVQLRNVQTNGSVQTVSLQIIRPMQLGQPDKKPLNLVWPLPSEIRRVEVPFVFHDLKIR